MAITVSAINRYLIKSCRGTSLLEAYIGRRGIMFDHECMVVDERDIFVTQRNAKVDDLRVFGIRSMCMIAPAISDGHMIVGAPEMPQIDFPLYETSRRPFHARIWRHIVEVQEVHPDVSEWFTTYLSRERPGRYRLVRMLARAHRFASAGRAETALSDGFPFLIVSSESHDEVNRRIEGPAVPIDRFRPTIVLSGSGFPHAEDKMDALQIRSVSFEGHWLCDRCPMPGIEQSSGKKDGRALLALGQYHRVKEGSDKVQFGRNFNHLNYGTIAVGDEVHVLKSAA